MNGPKVQARYDELAAGFLVPLLAGGTVRLGRPVTPGMLETFALSRPSDAIVEQELIERLHELGGELAPLQRLPWPDRGIMAVTMAAHDLALVTDPQLDRWGTRGARREILSWVDWFLEQAALPRSRGAALGTHAIVSRYLGLYREDVTARNWAFTHRYLGRPLPDGFFTRPRWVQLKTDKTPLVSLWTLLEEDLVLSMRLRTLLSRSPVTELLRTDLLGADPSRALHFSVATLAVLSDDLLRNGLARELVHQGRQVMHAFGGALRALHLSEPPPHFLYYAVCARLRDARHRDS